MPYKDKNTMKKYLEGYYAKNKTTLNKKRTETRRMSQTLDSVSNPVSNPVLDVSNPTVVSQTPTDISRKKLIDELKAKIATVPAVVKQYVPMKPVRPAYAPKIKSENYSESVQYDYSCV